MEKYENKGGNSGVDVYECGTDFIRVRFNDGGQYLYTNDSAGIDEIQKMQELARAGQGLNSFINKEIKKNYACKEM